MMRMMFRRTRSGILEALLQSRHFPALVIQIFVPFAVGAPSATWTCTGSSGIFSLAQKYTQYGPILKT